MKQLSGKKKKICILSIIGIIIVAGIIVTVVLGFNKELKYKQNQSIEIYVEQKVDKNKIKDIANQVLGKPNLVETIEIYQDMVSITAENISEEQKNEIVNKVKENYEFEQTAEDTSIKTNSKTRIIDMYKNYLISFAISGVIVFVYMIIRYRKIGILRVILRTLLIPIVAELVLLSIIAITRLPLGKFTPISVIAVYIISILYVIKRNEK